MKVLLTGWSGLIGSHLLEAIKDDYNVRCFVGDITNRVDVVRNLRDVSTVIAAAALTFVPTSWENPLAYMDVNYGGTLNFLENHRFFDRFIYFSTSHIMGNQRQFPIAVEQEPAPQDPYSVSKRAATDAVKLYSERFGFDTLVLRPYNNFGPRQSRNFVMPTMIRQALETGHIILKGDTQKELLYVKDTARAVKGLLDRKTTGTVQLCKGESYLISDIASMILNELGLDASLVEVQASDRAGWDIQKLQGDPSSLQAALPGFEWTPMPKAIQETIKYYRENG